MSRSSSTALFTRLWHTRLGIVCDPLLALIALLAVILPLIPADLASHQWHGEKTLVFELGAALLLGALPWFQKKDNAGIWRKSAFGSLFMFLLLTLWALASFLVSSPKAFALNGWWQIAGGLVVTYTVATRTRTGLDETFLLDTLTVASAIISLATFALYQSGGMVVADGPYHDHELAGAALMILLPLPLAGSISPVSTFRKSGALSVSVLCIVALLLTQTRSSWIGMATAGLLFGTLVFWCKARTPAGWRRSPGERRQWLQSIVYVALICVALGYFLISSDAGSLIAARAGTFIGNVPQGHEESVEWRLRSWRGALTMFSEKPLTGWGVGTYPYYQHPFTHQGEPINTVLSAGPTIPNEAHNSYLQIAVEMGLPGLILWLLTFGAAFYRGFRTLLRLPDSSLRQRTLIGGLSALAGYGVDAFANPAWQFGEIDIYLWTMLGLVLAVSSDRTSDRTEGQRAEQQPAKIRVPVGVAVGAFCVWITWRLIVSAHALPIPHL